MHLPGHVLPRHARGRDSSTRPGGRSQRMDTRPGKEWGIFHSSCRSHKEYQCEICSFENSSKAIGKQHEKLDHPPQELKKVFTCEKIVSNYWHKHQATMHTPTMCVVKIATKSSAMDRQNLEVTDICFNLQIFKCSTTFY